MKKIFRCEVNKKSYNQGSRKDVLVLSNIKDIDNYYFSEKAIVNCTKEFSKLSNLKDGDIIEFEAEVKEIVLAYPSNIKRFGKKKIERSDSAVKSFFSINK